jgi:predicted RNA-binding Zn ribbon-like protein
MNTRQDEFPVVAGRLCLDFVNTAVAAERLPTYQALVSWARAAGALDPAEADFVLERWAAGEEGDAALATALQLRRQRHDYAAALARGLAAPPASLIEALNNLLKSRPGFLQLERAGDEWASRWKVPLRRADDILWRVARSAASLLADDDLALVKRCQRPGCGLFFYDTTKNHRKRWCTPDGCGAAERAAAYYRRKGETRTIDPLGF